MTTSLLGSDIIVFLNKKTWVCVNEIMLLEALANYTKIHFEEKKPLIIAVTLKKIEPLVKDFGFLRIHKKYLINMNYADSSLLSNESVTIPNDVVIKVSRRKRSTLRRNLKQWAVA